VRGEGGRGYSPQRAAVRAGKAEVGDGQVTSLSCDEDVGRLWEKGIRDGVRKGDGGGREGGEKGEVHLEVAVEVPPVMHVGNPLQQLTHEPFLVSLRKQVRHGVQNVLGKREEGGREGGREGGKREDVDKFQKSCQHISASDDIGPGS